MTETHVRPSPAPTPAEAARACIVTADQLISQAIEAARDGDPRRAGELVGRSSDAIGSALHHLRRVTRHTNSHPASH
jgi:hypothetical protein